MNKYSFKINGHDYAVDIESIEGGKASVVVNGTRYDVELDGNAPAAAAAPSPAAAPVAVPAAAPAAAEPAHHSSEGTIVVKSPMPGTIIEVSVLEGDSVKRGQKVAVLESMKMENEILAEKDGVISRVFVTKGDQLSDGDRIVSIA